MCELEPWSRAHGGFFGEPHLTAFLRLTGKGPSHYAAISAPIFTNAATLPTIDVEFASYFLKVNARYP